MSARGNRAYLGLGSNIEPRKNVIRAIQMVAATGGVRLTGISTIYRTPALAPPPPEGEDPGDPPAASPGAERRYPDFLNAVLAIETSLEPAELEELLGQVEEALGRIRLPDRYAPRTMDLDLLLYLHRGRETATGEAHPDIRSRAFVALPLLELAPDLTLPPRGEPLSEVAAGFSGPRGTKEAGLTADLRARFLTGQS